MMGNTQRHLSSFSMAFLLLLSIGLPYATPEGTAYSQSDAPAPDIQVTPTVIEVTLREGQSTTVPLTIANAGDEELTFSISEQSIAPAVQSRQRPSWFAETLRRDDASPSNKVGPALPDAIDAARDRPATFLCSPK